MKYYYYAKSFNHKPCGKDNNELLNNAYESQYSNLQDIVDTWEHGYAFSFRDQQYVQALVIDIDNTVLDIDDKYIDDFNNKHNGKFYLTHGCSYYDTASKNYESKKYKTWKVFSWLESPITNDKEILELHSKSKVEELKTLDDVFSKITIDEHQYSPSQLTYGKPLQCGLDNKPLRTSDIHIDRKYGKSSSNKPSLEYFMKIFRKPSDTRYQIGVSKKNILGWVRHWYENKYNKSFPEATKYRIIAKTYTPYMRVVSDCGVRRIVQVIVQDNARHFVANKLVDIIAFNAFSRSVFYRDIPSITDCFNRLSFICNTTFEKKDNKNWIECWKVEYIHKLKVAYLEYLNNTDWSEYQKDDDLMDYIATHSLALEQDDIQWTYRPKDIELERFTKDSVYMGGLMDFANKNIEDIMNYYMIWDRIGNDCGGDVELMCKLMAALRRRVSFKIPKVRCDKNGHHKKHKEHSNKGKCLEGLVVEDNKVYIPKDVKVSSSIRKYCSKNSIKIVRS